MDNLDELVLDYEVDDSENVTMEGTATVIDDMALSLDNTFENISLKTTILMGTRNAGYKLPTEIQLKCIQNSRNDILCEAPSGTGKTSSFILTTLNNLECTKVGVQVLVLCPTRQLACKITEQYQQLSCNMDNVKVAAFVGGTPMRNDVEMLSNNCPDIVVGTPGRILSLIKYKKMIVANVRYFVIDECKIMILNMIKHINEIFSSLPPEKRVLMFASSLDFNSRKICKRYMRNILEISLDSKGTVQEKGLLQYHVIVNNYTKNSKLLAVLEKIPFNQAVIFVKSNLQCKGIENLLKKRNYSAVGIFRDLTQKQRLSRFEEFKAGAKRILVAVNIHGRGMNVERVNLVVNYDCPLDTDSYLYSISRAKGSEVGTAITFVLPTERYFVNELQKMSNNGVPRCQI